MELEFKQMFMLGVLVLVALGGSGILVAVLNNLDKKDDHHDEENGHGGGH